ncbi:PREDICTED: sorting nexin-6-like isoform X4 [Branchiostoma belcheri]|uniref:Sorting nexin n=1 Tax=Branchiostoma belcheri TaxID=7741 RepID=A0A6P4YNH2_BRABE|nr:PREDICTED: sorting nexin-6-like isoform X4 [Branchiostoma belcheri]
MMDGLDDSPDLLAEDENKPRTESVDLTKDDTLSIDISDALSERDRVKFTVHTKTTLPDFRESEFSVVRQHEEFIWLHDRFVENEEYGGYIIPPAPPRPDFDASREKLQKLGEGEGTMTKEEFTKMKQELEAEYLATFKKTVAMHEVFLQRLAAHPAFRKDTNFRVFLEYDQDLSVRLKNKKEKLGWFIKSMSQSVDEVLLSNQKDADEFFEQEKGFLVEYHNRIAQSTKCADRMTKMHKSVADSYIKLSTGLGSLATCENTELDKVFNKVSECFEKSRKLEARVSSDEDLKLSDTLRYYLRDTSAAKDLLYRRTRALADYENANKDLDKARAKNRNVQQAEQAQQRACEKYEHLSELAKSELQDFKKRRVGAFRKNLVELAELEIKHAKALNQLYRNCIAQLKEEGRGAKAQPQ